jgi:hypothetical protein
VKYKRSVDPYLPMSKFLSFKIKKKKLPPLSTCSCGLEGQTPDHILQDCPLLKTPEDTKPDQQ